jgi:hypothetical protein
VIPGQALKRSVPLVAQQVPSVFSVESSFPKAQRLLPVLPEKAPLQSKLPFSDLVASRQRYGWVRSFSPPPGRCALALLRQPASAPVQAQCLGSAPLRLFANSIPFSCFSAYEFESSRRSEIDREGSPKSPPEIDSGANRRSKH